MTRTTIEPAGVQAGPDKSTPKPSFWTSPRKTALRWWMFQIHFYLGLVLGLLWTVIGVTGSLIVFVPELRRSEVPGWTRVTPAGTALPLDDLYQRLRAVRPNDKPVRMDFDFKPGWAVNYGSAAPNGDQIHTFIDPYRGNVVGTVNYSHSVLQWIYLLHSDLLSGRSGRTVNGFFAVMFMIVSVAGMLLWWRGRRYWKLGLEYRVKASWKRQMWDLHNLAGFVFYLPLFLISITGVYYGYPEQFKAFLGVATRGPFPDIPPPDVAKPMGPHPRMNEMLDAAQKAIPDGTLSLIIFPTAPKRPIAYRMLRNSDLHRLGLNWVYMDPNDARVLRVDQLDQQPLGVQIFRVLAPFHYGHWAGWGVRIVWMLAGLVPGILFVTSLLLWWNRSLSKKWKRSRARSQNLEEKALA